MKISISSLFLCLFAFQLNAQFRCQELKHSHAGSKVFSIDNRAKSDTFDILNYDLHLDFTALPQRHLQGRCDISFTPKQSNSGVIELDLLQLQVDSVLQNGNSLSYTHNDTLLNIWLQPNPQPGDTLDLQVYYSGTPPGDGSGWGGWHQQNGYYYNLGVGFAADPHTYGRAWHPCFDNFVEKATYDFHVKTVDPLRPYCNGIRTGETTLNGDTLLTDWQMTDPIPTYLASITISNYVEIEDSVQGMNSILPIQLMVKQNDSAQVLASFINLKPSFHALEQAFGPYLWQRIGYCATTVGAMEHATSIHYPTNLINGNLNGEDIMVHELAHHWFGNLVTCETDADMWINEGMAEFCSHLYNEQVYGREEYLDVVQANAYFVLDRAHERDNAFRSIHNLPHEYVYGAHVYQKGAMVTHNLRNYMGDSQFFGSLTQMMSNYTYGNINSTEMRDFLSSQSGVSLNAFFDDWVFGKGFPQFQVDSLRVSQKGNGWDASLRIKQNTYGTSDLFDAVPVPVSFFSASGDTITRKLSLSGRSGLFQVQSLSFKPIFALAGYSGELLSADTYDEYLFTTNGSKNPEYSKMRLTASKLQDSLRVISMYHWAGAYGKLGAGVEGRLSSNRYWTIQGWDLENAELSARIDIDGSSATMDADLIAQTADSLVVLYRKDGSNDWTYWPHQSKTSFGPAGSIRGWIEVDSLVAGDYSLANVGPNISIKEPEDGQGHIEIYPNPAKNKLRLIFPNEDVEELTVKITDINGRKIYEGKHQPRNREVQIELKELSTGIVVVQAGDVSEKVVVR